MSCVPVSVNVDGHGVADLESLVVGDAPRPPRSRWRRGRPASPATGSTSKTSNASGLAPSSWSGSPSISASPARTPPAASISGSSFTRSVNSGDTPAMPAAGRHHEVAGEGLVHGVAERRLGRRGEDRDERDQPHADHEGRGRGRRPLGVAHGVLAGQVPGDAPQARQRQPDEPAEREGDRPPQHRHPEEHEHARRGRPSTSALPGSPNSPYSRPPGRAPGCGTRRRSAATSRSPCCRPPPRAWRPRAAPWPPCGWATRPPRP